MSTEYCKLCFRCEHRALNLETNGTHRPRSECAPPGAVYSCYMYRPVRPVVQEILAGDPRPVGVNGFISARASGLRILSGELHMEKKGSRKFVLYYKPPDNWHKKNEVT